jgi:ATP-binding cassette subfamily F protein uup
VVTSTFVFEGGGRVVEYVGGYEDWVRQRAAIEKSQRTRAKGGKGSSGGDNGRDPASSKTVKTPATVKKLSYKDQRELDGLPARIEALETEQRALAARVAAPEFYREGSAAIAEALARVDTLASELAVVYDRWHALEARAQ